MISLLLLMHSRSGKSKKDSSMAPKKRTHTENLCSRIIISWWSPTTQTPPPLTRWVLTPSLRLLKKSSRTFISWISFPQNFLWALLNQNLTLPSLPPSIGRNKRWCLQSKTKGNAAHVGRSPQSQFSRVLMSSSIKSLLSPSLSNSSLIVVVQMDLVAKVATVLIPSKHLTMS